MSAELDRDGSDELAAPSVFEGAESAAAGESDPVDGGDDAGGVGGEMPAGQGPADAVGDQGPAGEAPPTPGAGPDDGGGAVAAGDTSGFGVGRPGPEPTAGESVPVEGDGGTDTAADAPAGAGTGAQSEPGEDGPVEAGAGESAQPVADDGAWRRAEQAADAGTRDVGEEELPAPAADDSAGTLTGPPLDTGSRDVGERGPVDAGPKEDGDLPQEAAPVPDTVSGDSVANAAVDPEARKAWESAGDNSDFPASMQDNLNELGQNLRSDVDPNAWANAGQAERASMLANANDTIREAYGLPPGEVHYSSDLPDGVTGEYNPDTGRVTLNSSLFNESNAEEAIQTLAHENFHDYQQRAIDGDVTEPYAESRREAWSSGQADYDSEDYTAYMANPLEADAFAAEKAVFSGYRRQ